MDIEANQGTGHRGRVRRSRHLHGMVQGVREPDHRGSRQRVLHAVRARGRDPGEGRRRRAAGTARSERSGTRARWRDRGSTSRFATRASRRTPSSGSGSGAESGGSQGESDEEGFRDRRRCSWCSRSRWAAPRSARVTDNAATYEQLRLFTEVLSIVQNQYVDEVPPKDLIYNAIKGTLRGLDPHSSFLDPESYREMQVETSGSFGGLGIEITLKDDILTVVAPIDGHAGLPGRAAHRRSHRQDRRSVDQGHAAGRRGQAHARQARHQGHDQHRPRGLDRAEGLRHRPRADPRAVGEDRSSSATASSTSSCGSSRSRAAHDLEAALEKFSKGGMKALILDLRNNPGGLLTAAVEVTREVHRRRQAGRLHRGPRAQPEHALLGATQEGLRADCRWWCWSTGQRLGVRDRGRRAPGLGPGDRSWAPRRFGKGSVQTIIPLSDGSGLRLTTAKYFTPKGRSIHGKGITPDVVVEVPKEPTSRRSGRCRRPIRSRTSRRTCSCRRRSRW